MTTAKTVLITGAAQRVGSILAQALADDGWDIALHCRRSKAQAVKLAGAIRAKGRKATVVEADLADAAAVQRLIPSLTEQGVTLECLINNAALFGRGKLAGLEQGDLEYHMQVNLFAPLMLMRDFAAQYKGSAGNIINITDGMTGWSISPTFLSYALSKLGLGNATQLLAVELAPNIRVNAVAPGATLEGVQDKEDTFAKLKTIIPLKRTSSPEEIVGAVRYLLSAPSVTGQIISLSGGLMLPRHFEA